MEKLERKMQDILNVFEEKAQAEHDGLWYIDQFRQKLLMRVAQRVIDALNAPRDPMLSYGEMEYVLDIVGYSLKKARGQKDDTDV